MTRGFLRAAFLATLVAAVACGDSETTGPEFGDLEFQPDSPVELGEGRELTVELFNLSNETLGPIAVGVGSIPTSFPPGEFCQGLVVVIDPTQIQSISPTQSFEIDLTFDFAGLTEEDCPLATYEVDLNAALGSEVLGSIQVRLDRTALE